ncbi:MAG: hypothetical protein KDB62_08850 [Solirubrobacterales bacterium]|nr:hypothetical protein [Solirubrobacterales bacterium]
MEAGDETPSGTGPGSARRSRLAGLLADRPFRTAGVAAALAAAAFLFGVAPVVGDGLNRIAVPASPALPATRAASSAQVAATGLSAGPAALSNATASGNGKRKRVSLQSRVTDQPVVTEENQGSYVGVSCPRGSKAISGGVLNKYINLIVSSSAPNHPISGKYTPRTWWLTVTNANVDGQGGSLPWRGVVNCFKPVRLAR